MIKTVLTSLAILAGGMAWALTNFTPASQFEQHLENEESRYVLELKEQIRKIRQALDRNPSDLYLQNELEDAIDTLCEYRPEDRLCQ